ncbi:MAG: galactose mutarotase, partial [Roseburia sp.]|nr:galactose mutarotase [Roseburia sp.]
MITELDDTQAPTGVFLPVDGTPFDFRTMHTIGKYMNSDYEQYHKFGTYDHNFIINGTGLREAAVLQSKESGIRMTCFTDMPGMQLYVPCQPIEQPGKDGIIYESGTSVCLETQYFPDAINHDNFPSIVLHPGDTFHSKTLYHFSTF